MFDPADMSLPDFYAGEASARHPWVDELSRTINYGDHFKDADHVKRAIASYYALVAFVDEQIGAVLSALDDTGFTDNTRIVYSTDHGDNIGRRGLWGKSVMYEEAVAVPMITAGPDVEPGTRSSAPVSLVDVYRSALDAMAIPETDHDRSLPSMSLWNPDAIPADRSIVSEYHAMGSQSGCYMLRWGRWKYIHYVHHEPELFDVIADPTEVDDLSKKPDFRKILEEGRSRLFAVCNPEATEARVFGDQQDVLDSHGGADAILKRGDQLFTPPPGKGPDLHFADKVAA
jgi:choline-sulfatase